jgi:hypothetical protein
MAKNEPLYHAVSRTYTHRTFGKIGEAIMEVPVGTFRLNGNDLPDISVTHLMTFALQTLQDAYAGAKSTDEALGAFNTKLDRLLNGTIGTRSGGDGADERTRVARSVVQAAAKAKFGAKSPEWATFTGLSDDARNAKLDAWFASNEAAFTPAVEEEMARRAAKRDANKGLGATIDISL